MLTAALTALSIYALRVAPLDPIPDIADPQVILRCLGGLTQEPESVLAAASAPEAKSRVRQNTQRAMELGIFGAPTFIAEGELFWGNDRLETAFEWSRSRGARFEPVG